jgi:hypothetical protein
MTDQSDDNPLASGGGSAPKLVDGPASTDDAETESTSAVESDSVQPGDGAGDASWAFLDDRVEADPNRVSHEKETHINFLGDANEMRVFSAKRAIVSQLVKHPHFELKWASVEGARTNAGDVQETDGAIWAVSGMMPIGCLTIKSSPRTNNHQSQCVNYEGVDPDAFS